MEFNELTVLRRSVRSYEPGHVIDDETIKKLILCVQLAPSWKNSQTGRYYVVNKPEMVEEYKKTCVDEHNQPRVADASAFIITSYKKGEAGYNNGAPVHKMGDAWGAYDLGLQAAYLCLKASDMGLDTLIMGLNNYDEIRKLVDFPADEEAAAVIALGFRKGEPVFKPRKELDEVLRFL